MTRRSAERTVAITGASGLIGRRLCSHFHSRGWGVHALLRDMTPDHRDTAGIRKFECHLPHSISPESLRGVDVLIHAAYSTRGTDLRAASEVNEVGSRRLFELAADAGIAKTVFLSSFSARPDAKSYYGRSKYAVEQLLDPSRDLAIRLGLVLAPDGGLFQRICDSMRSSRYVPVLGGSRIVQTLHIDDLCVACERAVDLNLTGLISVAEPTGLPFKRFLALLAAQMGGRTLIPLPILAAYFALRCAERAGIQAGVSSENLMGIRMLKHIPVEADLAKLGLTVRSAASSLSKLFDHNIDIAPRTLLRKSA